jgi:HlyD family secretion protein
MFSPISGRVTKITSKIGEQVIAAAPVITVQTIDNQFEIRAYISESDITKVALNDVVLLVFDAFGKDRQITGFVGKIDPAEKIIENVVYYEATVYINPEGQSLDLRPGLSADLIVQTDVREDVVTLPQRAVLERDGIKYVRVLVNGMVEEREVETGLRGDLGRIEITSGLEVGEEVVIRELSE